MAYRDIIRAWKGKEHGRRLSKEQDVGLPEHSAGLTELADAELDDAAGADWIPYHLGGTYYCFDSTLYGGCYHLVTDYEL